MSLTEKTPSPSSIAGSLGGVVNAFPDDSRKAARLLVEGIARVLVQQEGQLRRDIDSELQRLVRE